MSEHLDRGKDILLVDDSPVVADAVREALAPFGYRVTWIPDGADVPAALDKGLPDLVILDVIMPGVDGYEVCRRLRASAATAHLPILMLTARTKEVDKVVGLELGADDYLAKPFGERELLARVRALLRRAARTQAPAQMLHAGPVTLDLARHEARCAGTSLDLTPTEFDLLHLLVLNVGQTLERDTLLNRVWGYDWYGNSRVVDTHIQHLRQKLRQHCPEGEELIVTVRTVGYRFAG
jgi:two-component system alkaline phosphatase synthesis response regulator PhoP